MKTPPPPLPPHICTLTDYSAILHLCTLLVCIRPVTGDLMHDEVVLFFLGKTECMSFKLTMESSTHSIIDLCKILQYAAIEMLLVVPFSYFFLLLQTAVQYSIWFNIDNLFTWRIKVCILNDYLYLINALAMLIVYIYFMKIKCFCRILKSLWPHSPRCFSCFFFNVLLYQYCKLKTIFVNTFQIDTPCQHLKRTNVTRAVIKDV